VKAESFCCCFLVVYRKRLHNPVADGCGEGITFRKGFQNIGPWCHRWLLFMMENSAGEARVQTHGRWRRADARRSCHADAGEEITPFPILALPEA